MRPDKFLIASGLVVDAEVDDTALEALRDAAYDFLRGGGVVSLDEYANLSRASRDALSDAGFRLDQLRAELAASAVAEMIEDLAEDDSEESEQSAVDALADKFAEVTA